MGEHSSEMEGWHQPQHGSFCWTEIASSDADACQAFYTKIFGWKFQGGDAANTEMDYREFMTGGDAPVGGLYQINPMWFEGSPPPPHLMTYIAVDDVDGNAKAAVELGGKIYRGPMDIPNVGRMCMIEDPTGAVFCTFRMKD